METLNEKKTVGEIAAGDYRHAEVFRKYGIDFCCGGKKSLAAACSEKGLTTSIILGELSQLHTTAPDTLPDYNRMDLDKLADYIVSTHHAYVIRSMPEIFEYGTKVARVHGHSHPEVKEILNNFINIMNELNSHMMKEENILFPYIRHLAECSRTRARAVRPPFGTIKHPIQMMEFEHDIAGNILEKLQDLSRSFTPPDDACNTFRMLYGKLREFDRDLRQHIHLENNILLPKAVNLERQTFGTA